MSERITITHARRMFERLCEQLGRPSDTMRQVNGRWEQVPGGWRLEEWRPGDGHTRVRIAVACERGGESNPYPYYMSPSQFYHAALFTLRILEEAKR